MRVARTASAINAARKIHFLFVRIAAEIVTALIKNPISSRTGGEGTRTEDEGSRANQRIDAASTPIKDPRPRPRKTPKLFQTEPRASVAKPKGTMTPESSTAGTFATGAIKDTR